jgi:hypothetical protein
VTGGRKDPGLADSFGLGAGFPRHLKKFLNSMPLLLKLARMEC